MTVMPATFGNKRARHLWRFCAWRGKRPVLLFREFASITSKDGIDSSSTNDGKVGNAVNDSKNSVTGTGGNNSTRDLPAMTVTPALTVKTVR
ncbi:hypothetical protein [Paenarthrobacter ureafaciens]|uniref:hypothetical protein n=1 Tax=Paenarthrobacter ureafaciens TaxID=37931 RepID=UPI00140787E9|nr:hypothetical protein [Paenarthrobacter ureafaciens]MCX8456545.1 hypothetical protein [Paenarthrobacter ureafaciens]MCY0974408.1 hypothetical protein [Paenarthrobacter ureafaciens]